MGRGVRREGRRAAGAPKPGNEGENQEVKEGWGRGVRKLRQVSDETSRMSESWLGAEGRAEGSKQRAQTLKVLRWPARL